MVLRHAAVAHSGNDVLDQMTVTVAAVGGNARLGEHVLREDDFGEVAAVDERLNVVQALPVVDHIVGSECVVRRFPPEEVVFEHRAALREFEESRRVEDRPVEVSHDDAADVRARFFQNIEYLEGSARVASRVYEYARAGCTLCGGAGAEHLALVVRQRP